MLSVELLKSEGFVIYKNPDFAILRVTDHNFLYLKKKEGKWIFGHSVDGHFFFLRPGGDRRYQYINSMEELKMEILWLKKYGARSAIEISKALVTSAIYNIPKRNSNRDGYCLTKV